jgi:N-ethylmaleimide reductase
MMTKLFEPFNLAGLPLANRTAMAPMTRTRATDDRVPTELMRDYYAQRASAGLIVTECVAVRDDSAGIIRAPGIYTEAQVKGWRMVTDAVHAASGRIYLQLWHGGRISHPSLQPGGDPPIAPSAVAAEGLIYVPEGRVPYPVPRALALAEIAPIIEAFGTGAANAKRAGFDGVELHGAFGYLPDQFLQDETNQRTDRYGGSVENRARFMLEITEAMIAAWDRERVGIKLSPSSRFYGQRDNDAAATFGHAARSLDAMGVGYLHLMEPSPADISTGTVQIENVTQTMRPLFKGTLITNGGYDRTRAEAILESGDADMVSFGVPFIANPDLVKRMRANAAFNAPDPSTFYGEGPKGYTDYPMLAA